MRFIFLLGGAAGFSLLAATGYVAGHAADRVLFDAAAGCLAGALLFRWFWTVVVRAMRETVLHRRQQAAAAPAPSPAK